MLVDVCQKYVKDAVVNLEATIAKRDMRLPTSHSTIPTKYHPRKNVNNELNSRGVQAQQELIGEIRWAAEIRRIEILMEVVLLSLHLALSRSGHLQAVYQIFGYMKQVPKRKLYFDPVSPSISKDRFQKFDWEEFY